MDAKTIFNKKGKFIIFKHSTRCGLSEKADSQVKEYKALPKALPIIVIPVLKEEKLKMQIAKNYKVKHESPQILLIDDQKCTENFSHQEVTLQNLKKL
jgi:bacillithiol system protein YtxJ